MERWIEEGQQKWFGERVVMRLVAVYQPSEGGEVEEMEMCIIDMERQIGVGADNKLVIGGDFNTSVGRNSERQGICGRDGNVFKPAHIVVGAHAQTLSWI